MCVFKLLLWANVTLNSLHWCGFSNVDHNVCWPGRDVEVDTNISHTYYTATHFFPAVEILREGWEEEKIKKLAFDQKGGGGVGAKTNLLILFFLFFYKQWIYHLGCWIPGEQSKETILVLYIPSLKASNDSRYSTVLRLWTSRQNEGSEEKKIFVFFMLKSVLKCIESIRIKKMG